MQRRRFDLNLHVEAESPVRFGNPFLPPGETTFSPNQTLNEDCGVYEYLVRQEPSPLPVHSEHFNQTLEYFLSCRDRQIAIVSAAPPFHIQYVNKAWSDACGWNAEEVIGCDCKFLQGEATNAWSITKFMRKICDVDFCGEAELNVLNYRKDGTIISNKLVCVTVKSTDSDDEWDAEKHFACISELTEVFGSVEKTTYKSAKYNPLRELGMPIDRREQCNIYPHFARHPAPKLMEWAKLSSKLNLPLTMQYIIETQAAALLTDR
jgi:PAS domain-containing protein